MYNDKIDSRQMIIEGPTLEDCKVRLYQRYGNRYQIISHRVELKGGILGFGQKEVVCANYVVDERFGMGQSPTNGNYGMSRANSYTDRTVYSGGQETPNQISAGQDFANRRDEFLKNQLGSGGTITNLMQMANLSKQIQTIAQDINSIKEATSGKELHPTIRKIDSYLEQNEFTQSYIEKINARIRNELTYEDLDDFDLVQNHVVDWIADSIAVAPKFSKSKKNCHTIIIVGPTGVGKTTTVAKMAAKLKLAAKNKKLPSPVIQMITTDTMKVGAEEQLEHYGGIMGVNVTRAMTTEDLKDLYDSYKSDVDFIFIDTSGYSPRDFENIGKMRTLLDVDGMKADIYLAVSATTKPKDLENILRNFEPFNFRSVIITKCDETLSYGNVLSVLFEKNKSISWLTTGQNVLHSLERAHPMHFLKYLTGFTVDKDHILEKYGPEEEAEESQ
ncbi:MAG: hypothetical protein J5930_05545 [Treponema sp.]|nr:hypothetical protein [Treponema sp.]